MRLTVLCITLAGWYLCVSANGQNRLAKPENSAPRSGNALQRGKGPALAALVGRSLYVCRIDEIEVALGRFYDGVSSRGVPLARERTLDLFRPGDKLTIYAAEISSVPPDRPDSIAIALGVHDERSGAEAGVQAVVSSKPMGTTRLLSAIAEDQGLSSTRLSQTYPAIGMTRQEVYCLMGSPLHINSDALSGDQLVYPGETYVYINRRGLVEDVQSTN